MAENKKAIIVYADWIDQFEALENEEAGLLIKHFFRYVNDLNPIAPDRITEIAFASIKASLKRDLDKWEKTINDRSVNGRMGNLKRYNVDLYDKVESDLITLEEAEAIAKTRKSSPPDSPPTETVAKLAVSDSVNVSVIVKESIEERKLKFASTLKPYLLMYGADMLNDFYAYWTEHGDKDKKFRSEKETSFSVERRLETWKKNEKVFNKPQKADRL